MTNPAAPQDALIIDSLSKEYVRGKTVLRNISLSVANVGITAIIGPSGTGKSTLLRCINRLVEPSSGSIRIGGLDICKLSGSELRAARRRIGMIFQEFNLVDRLSVMENVLCGRLGYVSAWRVWLRKFPREDIDKAFELLDHVGLSDFVTVRADSLSGGQRQRVGIARALMQQPQILLADEPTASLDPKTSVEIMELLLELSASHQMPVLVNMHDVILAKRFATRMIGLSEGSMVFDGPPAELEDRHLKLIYGGEEWLR
jgi:phosphonate transport system ATP-binding protein